MYGRPWAAQVVGFALGALISGVVYDSTGSYRDAFTLFLVIAVAGSLLVIIAKRPAPPEAGAA
jgi:predicted MFS family arabinose efflux permease